MLDEEIFRVIIRDIQPLIAEPLKSRIIESVMFFEDAFKSNYMRTRVTAFGSAPNGFRHNLGMNNDQIYSTLLNAVERNGNIEHRVADLFLTIIPGKSPDGRTMGYVENHSRIIYTYEEFIESLSLARLSGHFAHEWCHLLGFTHPINTGLNQPYLDQTVPYGIQNLVESYVSQRLEDFMIG